MTKRPCMVFIFSLISMVLIRVLVFTFIGLVWTSVFAADNKPCGTGEIELNTNIPFIGKCISKNLDESVTADSKTTVSNAFPLLMGWLMKVLMAVILVWAFMAILVGGLMMAWAGFNSSYYGKGKNLIIMVLSALALIAASWAILNAINPNFFRTESSRVESIKSKV